MRPAKFSIGVAGSNARFLGPGFTPWIVLNYLQNFFDALIYAIPSSDAATNTMQGQFTVDPQDMDVGNHLKDDIVHDVTITRAAAVATVTDLLGHGLTTGDGVSIFQAGAPFDGEQPVVTVTGPTTYTYPCANSGSLATGFNVAKQIIARVFPLATITGATRVIQTLSPQIATAVRLNVQTLTAGYIDFGVLQGSGSYS